MTESPSDQDAGQPASSSTFQDTVKLLGDNCLPLEVGRIEIGSDGSLRAREGDRPLHFNFAFRGFDFDVLVKGGEASCIQLRGMLGTLPFTAESGAARRAMSRLVALGGALNRGRLALSQKGEIVIEAEAVPPAPRTPISIMAVVAALLLEALPHLTLITEVLKRKAPAQSSAS